MAVKSTMLSVLLLLIAGGDILADGATTGNPNMMNQDFDITWGGDRGKFMENGRVLTLSMDRNSGSGFQSRNMYLYGKFDIQMKLVPGNSAGTVTSYFLMSERPENRDEIDLEFLGNLTGDPYTLHTNIYTQGKGEREQQFRLWFDPTKDFHTYSILWNPSTILISVDGTPVRHLKNMESKGIPFPKAQPMKIYSSIYDADQWATRGGQIKTDWRYAPFVSTYRSFNAKACVRAGPKSRDSCSPTSLPPRWIKKQQPNPVEAQKLRVVQKNYMIYNYCTDTKRFPKPPPECRYMKEV